MQQMIQCPNCGAPNTPDRRFCGNCGSPLPMVCPYCGHSVIPGYTFCGNCGAPLGGFAQQPGYWGPAYRQPSMLGTMWQKVVYTIKTSKYAQYSILTAIVICLGIFIYFQVFHNPDVTAPVISNIQVSQTGRNTATIMWRTNEPASSQVEYGKNTNFGSFAPDYPTNDPTTGTTAGAYNHKVYIYRLSSDTTYYYRVLSKDAEGNLAYSQGIKYFRTEGQDPFFVPGTD
jgi:hypothetical protein